MVEYNPFLRGRQNGSETNKGDADSIETYGEPVLMEWQTRAALPSADENALGDALEAIFSEEIYALDLIVRRLNEQGLETSDGKAWTEEAFKAELKRLAGDEV